MRYLLIISILLFAFVFPVPKVEASVHVSAESAVLIDQSTGRVLYEKNANERSLIASITKIMTAIVAIESGKLNEYVSVSDRSIGTEGSSIYLTKEDQFTLEELVYGLMLRSGNDAAVAISEQVGGSEEGFVHLMNEKADWIGMTDTHFDNPHGLDSDTHFSTAYDMALLMKYAMENETFVEISGTKSFKANDRDYSWHNKNKLLTSLYEYCIGGKTGYTKAAGRTLVTAAEKNGQRLIAVTINGPDDWNDHIQMFEWGFQTFDQAELQSKGVYSYQKNKSGDIVQGKVTENLTYPLKAGEIDQIEAKITLTTAETPTEKLGKKVFYLNEEKIAETTIYRMDEKVNDKSGPERFWPQLWSAFSRIIGGNYD
ncbi:D-alanyl-D-alanine carboxypeptidase [Gracilibacillus oryzae]|uniref:D-alanyl-D-alanine carboxypeptidase n=1 Tax=Gracilibacillus oryzae TaxID=1672701 RepID=A0A7C8KTV0_9BACI|nr:D-alanyl-D-alanine carboxypeptidase family protein [Gracilibacillus oryzae]KAB8138377.1 D-alanyl-D-alanine carboxypeptidase [Gracilibacillus oryzae]